MCPSFKITHALAIKLGEQTTSIYNPNLTTVRDASVYKLSIIRFNFTYKYATRDNRGNDWACPYVHSLIL